jgi:hypothetical protein
MSAEMEFHACGAAKEKSKFAKFREKAWNFKQIMVNIMQAVKWLTT